MTPKQHANKIADEARELIFKKYMAGQEEHGGQLWRKKGLLNQAIMEAIDQVVYLLTLWDQLEEKNITLGDIDE